MKKLNLLLPEIHTGKERVCYLAIPRDISLKMIEENLKTGSIIFQRLDEQLKKPACRTVEIMFVSRQLPETRIP